MKQKLLVRSIVDLVVNYRNIYHFQYIFLKYFLIISGLISIIVGIIIVTSNTSYLAIALLLLGVHIISYLLNERKYTVIAAFLYFAVASVSMFGFSYKTHSEDEQSLRSVIGQLLKNLKYKGTILADGEGLIREYEAQFQNGNPYSGVILDLTVPGGIGGKEVMKRLREINPQIKGILSSGYGTSEIMQNFAEYGFQGILVKPYSINEFNDAVLRLID